MTQKKRCFRFRWYITDCDANLWMHSCDCRSVFIVYKWMQNVKIITQNGTNYVKICPLMNWELQNILNDRIVLFSRSKTQEQALHIYNRFGEYSYKCHSKHVKHFLRFGCFRQINWMSVRANCTWNETALLKVSHIIFNHCPPTLTSKVPFE